MFLMFSSNNQHLSPPTSTFFSSRYDLPEQCRLKMTENDIKTGKELLQEAFIMKNPEWMKELQTMVKSKEKAEIQALSSFGFQYVTEVYLPRK